MVNLKFLNKVSMIVAILCIICPFFINLGLFVPFTFGTFAIYLVSALATPLISVLSVFLYLLLGALGLPVFAGFSGGLSAFFSPSGGYLLSFLIMAGFISFFCSKFFGFVNNIIIMFFATLICYVFGTVQLCYVLSIDWGQGFLIGVLPYVFFDAIKMLCASFLSCEIRKRIGVIS